jgi:hypothetical protein
MLDTETIRFASTESLDKENQSVHGALGCTISMTASIRIIQK